MKHKLFRFLTDKGFRFGILASRNMLPFMSDRQVLEKLYWYRMGEKLNLEDPKTFNEKLQWLKLYDRRPEYTRMVDKYEVKQYIAERIGEEYVIPTLGVWDCFDEIDFDALPDSFVLKCTHDSGGLVICRDKSRLDVAAAKRKIEKSLKRNYFYGTWEWPYKNVKPRILAEVYMEDEKTAELRDYKLFCFDGAVKCLFVATERQKSGEEVKFDFFDRRFSHLELQQGHPNAKICPEKPAMLGKMISLAEELSEGIPQVRVDFYEVNGKLYFGELTFFHFSGMVPFNPPEWDRILGEHIKLSQKNMGRE